MARYADGTARHLFEVMAWPGTTTHKALVSGIRFKVLIFCNKSLTARIAHGYWGSQRFSFSTPAGDKPQILVCFLK
jgi:hypothetical protein